MKKVAIILSQDLLSLKENHRLLREAKTLINSDYEVTAFCWARGLDKYETQWEVEKDRIKIVRIFQDVSNGFFSERRAIKNAMKQLTKKVEEYSPDVIHAHDLETLNAAASAVKSNNTKLIFDMDENWPVLKMSQNWFLRRHYAKKQKSLIDKVDAVIAPSDELAIDIEKSTVLFNSEAINAIKKPVENHRFGLDGVVAGYIGTLKRDILEGIIEAGARINAVSLLIVGGPLENQKGYAEMIGELEEISKEKGANAKFTGPLPYSMMNECYTACDVLMVGPYHPEPLRDNVVPEKLLNAMAYKIPVVVEPYNARKRIVERYRCGIVSDDWATSLSKLADDKELRNKMGLNGFKAFEMNYAWELQEEKLLEIYNNLLKNNE